MVARQTKAAQRRLPSPMSQMRAGTSRMATPTTAGVLYVSVVCEPSEKGKVDATSQILKPLSTGRKKASPLLAGLRSRKDFSSDFPRGCCCFPRSWEENTFPRGFTSVIIGSQFWRSGWVDESRLKNEGPDRVICGRKALSCERGVRRALG